VGATRDKVKRAVRKTVKWGGAGLTVLLVVVWIGSWWASYPGWPLWPSGPVVLRKGWLLVIYPLNPGPWEDVRWVDRTIPLWLPSVLSLLATAAAWRADLKRIRRARAGLCGSCGYDRAGLPAHGRCPECGAAGEAQKGTAA
jgi:hypothetical protein